MAESPTPPLPVPVAASDSASASPVAARKLDTTAGTGGASRNDRPPRGTDLPLKPGRNYLNNGTNFVRSPKGE